MYPGSSWCSEQQEKREQGPTDAQGSSTWMMVRTPVLWVWPRLPREVVESPSLQRFKNCMDTVLSYMLWMTLSGPGDLTVVPFKLTRSGILWSLVAQDLPGGVFSSGYESLKRGSALSNLHSLGHQKDKINLSVYFLNITIPGNSTVL